MRYSLSASLESHTGRYTFSNQLFVIYSTLRLRENFTGFLLDTIEPEPAQLPASIHGHRPSP